MKQQCGACMETRFMNLQTACKYTGITQIYMLHGNGNVSLLLFWTGSWTNGPAAGD